MLSRGWSAGDARRRSACDRGSPGAGYRQGARRSHSSAAPGPRCAGSWCRRLEDGVEGCGEVRFAVADQGLKVLEPLAEAEGDVAGFAVTPPRCIQRVPCPVNTRTCSLLRSMVSTCRKSTATIPAVWPCRNCRQLGPERRGAGSMPAACRISHTVEGATVTPSFCEFAVTPALSAQRILLRQAGDAGTVGGRPPSRAAVCRPHSRAHRNIGKSLKRAN